MKARLTAQTEADLLRGINWFDRISTGLGEAFEAEFYHALERVKVNPELFAADHTGYRPCRLKRFTAVLYFRIDDRSWWLSGCSPAAKMSVTFKIADNKPIHASGNLSPFLNPNSTLAAA